MNKANDNSLLLHKAWLALTFLCGVVQLLFFYSNELAYSVFICCFSTALLSYYLFYKGNFTLYPISGTQLLLFNFTSTNGALLLKTIEWSSLVEGLNRPSGTFNLLLVSQIVLIIGHVIFRMVCSKSLGQRVLRNLVKSVGGFDFIGSKELLSLGFIGVLSFLLRPLLGFKFDTETDQGGNLLKFINGFNFFIYAPLLNFFFQKFYDQLAYWKPYKKTFYIAYFILLIVLGSLFNSRAVFADAFILIVCLFLILFLYNKISIRWSDLKKGVVYALFGFPIFKVLTSVAVAIVMVRELRSDSSVSTLFSKTFEVLTQGDKLSEFDNEYLRSQDDEYNEFYMSNPFANRLVQTKFHDNIMYYGENLSADAKREIVSTSYTKSIATLPDPILKMLKIKINKDDLMFSNGDVVVNLATGIQVGGRKTGSMVAEGYSVFGVYFLLILLFTSVGVCFLSESFLIYSKAAFVFSPIFLLSIYYLGGSFGMIYAIESMSGVISYLVRGIPQMLFLLWFVRRFFTNKLTR